MADPSDAGIPAALLDSTHSALMRICGDEADAAEAPLTGPLCSPRTYRAVGLTREGPTVPRATCPVGTKVPTAYASISPPGVCETSARDTGQQAL